MPEIGTLKGMGEGLPKPTPARFAVAENLRRLMREYRDPESGVKGLSSRQLAAKAPQVSYKTIDRLLDPYHDSSPRLDSLDAIAHFFEIDTFQLMLPQRRPMVSGSEPRMTESHMGARAITHSKKRTGR